MSCVEVLKWPKGLAAQRPKVLLNSSLSSGSSGSSGGGGGGSSSVVLRTSGVTTRRLSPCTHAYIGMLRREVAGLADLHLITDLSLTAPDGLPTDRLRAHADEHEAQLEWAPMWKTAAQAQGLRPIALQLAPQAPDQASASWQIPSGWPGKPASFSHIGGRCPASRRSRSL